MQRPGVVHGQCLILSPLASQIVSSVIACPHITEGIKGAIFLFFPFSFLARTLFIHSFLREVIGFISHEGPFTELASCNP